MESNPILSICIITYNHALYISQAIEGALQQKLNCSWELIIADDYSTDGTRQILLDYKAKYPESIKLILQDKNVGPHKNWDDLVAAGTGKYIAYSDGDDYWTDPCKLQKQLDLLQSNPQYNMACHLGENFFEKTGEKSIQPFYKEQISFEDFAAKGCMVHTMSIMYRNLPGIKEGMKMEWTKELSGSDLLLFFLLTLNGKKVYCFNEVMGVYRIHGKGIWSSSDYRARADKAIKNNLVYKKHLPLDFRQKMYLNYFMKDALINILYIKNKGARYYVNKIINKTLSFWGPGIISGLMAETLYRITKKRWNLPTY